MRIGGDATPVVTHGDMAVFMQFQLNPGGMARDGLVHRVIDDFRDHMVQRAIVLAPDVHAGAQAHVLHILKNLDRRGIIFLGVALRTGKKIGHVGACLSVAFVEPPTMPERYGRGKGG